jgi:hypothetical protein
MATTSRRALRPYYREVMDGYKQGNPFYLVCDTLNGTYSRGRIATAPYNHAPYDNIYICQSGAVRMLCPVFSSTDYSHHRQRCCLSGGLFPSSRTPAAP